MIIRGATQKSFAVPVTAAQYAPEVLYLNGPQDGTKALDILDQLVLLIPAIVATAIVEIDLGRPGIANPGIADANYYLAAITHNTAGYKGNLLSAGWGGGARIRVKSGGTAGTQVIGVTW